MYDTNQKASTYPGTVLSIPDHQMYPPDGNSHRLTDRLTIAPAPCRMLALQVIAVILVAVYILMMILSKKNEEARKKGF